MRLLSGVPGILIRRRVLTLTLTKFDLSMTYLDLIRYFIRYSLSIVLLLQTPHTYLELGYDRSPYALRCACAQRRGKLGRACMQALAEGGEGRRLSRAVARLRPRG